MKSKSALKERDAVRPPPLADFAHRVESAGSPPAVIGAMAAAGPVTVKDVARAAGVSTATVSRVLSGTDSRIPISDNTRRRVLAAVNDLGYRTNFFARSLRTRKSQTVGLVVADIRDPFFTEIIAGIERAATELGYFYLLSSAEDNPSRERLYMDIFRLKRVDGILIAGATEKLNDSAVANLVADGIPVVLVGREYPDRQVPSVTVDNALGSQLAMDHLIRLGHRRIAHLNGGSAKPDSLSRSQGYRRALAAAKIKPDPRLEVDGGVTMADGYRGMRQLLTLARRPTAVFCFDDRAALGALRAIREAGLSAPGNVSVVGFDDLDLCEYMVPPLTTVRQPRFDLGYEGMKLFTQIDAGGRPEHPLVLTPELIVRASTGPVPV
jgi:DNA-binding LacI/PurR family transcriptional regulator